MRGAGGVGPAGVCDGVPQAAHREGRHLPVRGMHGEPGLLNRLSDGGGCVGALGSAPSAL